MNDKKLHRVLLGMPIIPALKREIIRQESKWGDPNAPKQHLDNRLGFIQKHVKAAQDASAKGDATKAIEELNFLTALSIATLISQTQ